MSRQVIIEIRLGCKKRIIYRQDPVPQGHEVTSFQNTMVNTHLGRRLNVFSTGTQYSWLKYTRTTNGDATDVHTTKSHHLNPATASCIDNNRLVIYSVIVLHSLLSNSQYFLNYKDIRFRPILVIFLTTKTDPVRFYLRNIGL